MIYVALMPYYTKQARMNAQRECETFGVMLLLLFSCGVAPIYDSALP